APRSCASSSRARLEQQRLDHHERERAGIGKAFVLQSRATTSHSPSWPRRSARSRLDSGTLHAGVSERTSNEVSVFDYLIVGAGFSGSVLAERLASQLGKRVLVCDRRNHVGGNAYDCYDSAGVLIHQYGPHIFHTESQRIFNYLSQFTEWRPYEHRVVAHV